jgi:uncharacterized membrane protein
VSRDSLDDVRTDSYGGESTGSIGTVLGSVVAVVLYLALAWTVITLPLTEEGLVRFVVAVPLLLFLPGYTFLSALFPGRPFREIENTSPLSRSARFGSVRSIEQRGITWGERTALSFGLSLVWLPILALILAAAPFPLTTEPIFATVSAFVVLAAAIGALRRARLPPDERFVPPYQRWLVDARTAFSRSPTDTVLTAVLVLSMLAAFASISYALAVPMDATESSEFFVGTVNESGDLTYDGYPATFTAGQPVELTVGIENQEGRRTDYTVLAQFQRVEVPNASGSNATVLERREAARFETTVPANDTRDNWRRQHQVTPPFSTDDGNVRLVYLLYTDGVPADPTIGNADYHTWVWPAGDAPPNRPGASGTNATAGPNTTAAGPNTTASPTAADPNTTASATDSTGSTPGPNASTAPSGPNGTGPNSTSLPVSPVHSSVLDQ